MDMRFICSDFYFIADEIDSFSVDDEIIDHIFDVACSKIVSSSSNGSLLVTTNICSVRAQNLLKCRRISFQVMNYFLLPMRYI